MKRRNNKKRKHIKTQIIVDDIIKEEKKTKMERMKIYAEVEEKIYEHRLESELASKILMSMMDNYLLKGTTYINKELTLDLRADIPRKYVVNLFNDKDLTDSVVIRSQKNEIRSQKNEIRSVDK
jgi:hypothetical protein